MQANEIPAEIVLKQRAYWKEYVSLPIEANKIALSALVLQKPEEGNQDFSSGKMTTWSP